MNSVIKGIFDSLPTLWRSRIRRVAGFRHRLRDKKRELPWRLWRGLRSPPGSAPWLIRREVLYGGIVTDVPRKTVSAADPRTPAQLNFGGMTGGDRMLHSRYAEVYERYLRPFLGKPDVTFAEFGILNGTGLAIWCDLFPQGTVLGFDIDLQHCRNNYPSLRGRGAFSRREPELHVYDQLLDNSDKLQTVLGARRLDVVTDDGMHTAAAIVNTWRSVKPFLAENFVYFVEDFGGLLDQCGNEFDGFLCRSFGNISVISPLIVERQP